MLIVWECRRMDVDCRMLIWESSFIWSVIAVSSNNLCLLLAFCRIYETDLQTGEAKHEKYSENCLNWKQDEVSSIHPLFRTTLHCKKICLRNASEDNKWLKGFKAFQAFSALSVSVISIAGDGIQRIPTCQGWTLFDTTQGYWKRDRNQLHFETYKSTLSIQNIHVILQSRSSPDKCLWNGIHVLRSVSDILTFRNRWNSMTFKNRHTI